MKSINSSQLYTNWGHFQKEIEQTWDEMGLAAFGFWLGRL